MYAEVQSIKEEKLHLCKSYKIFKRGVLSCVRYVKVGKYEERGTLYVKVKVYILKGGIPDAKVHVLTFNPPPPLPSHQHHMNQAVF